MDELRRRTGGDGAMPGFGEATRLWALIGLLSFGGPAGQIALMHRELVEKRRWIADDRFLHALNFCMLLPGPEAQQLATYIGWLLHGVRGGLVAGLLFILPGFLLLLGLSSAYALWHETGWLTAVFFGLKAAVLAIVFEAVLRLGRRSLRTRWQVGLAAAAFLALFVFAIPFPLVILAAGLVGYVVGRAPVLPVLEPDPAPTQRGSGALATLAIGGLLWVAPLTAVLLWLGPGSTLASLWTFFSQMALVTFGGAYAVLAYVAQQAVQHYGWLNPAEMVDGLALAETTPGPLVLVLSFVGFLAAFRDATGMPPLLAGVVGATLTAWVTFVPCFMWIFAGAPYVERLRGRPALAGALSGIGAAAVGVILNLALWFALHVLFVRMGTLGLGPIALPVPDFVSLRLAALALGGLALALLLRLRFGVLPTLAICAAAGIALGQLGWAG